MIKNLIRYLANLSTILKKIYTLHRFSVFLDESTPRELHKSLLAWRLFKREYGYLRSLKENQCVDGNGNPIPWYTYPAIEQLRLWDFSDCDVLEYGCGNSTKWWAARSKSVTSIENSKLWYEIVSQNKPNNCQIILSEIDNDNVMPDQVEKYINVIDQLNQYDVIVIDGFSKLSTRKKCTEKALSHLKPDGLLIVDNSDWLPETCQILRDAGFFEIDFSGLSPLNAHAETTSLFFKSDFKIRPIADHHPGYATGGLKLNYDLET
ncbi:class I SAM-dependent methyltransferase [Methylotuvimicrobium buryatense]|uniref:SAM-dependent methyltransferase n=1 Tax=Methylotuvimicrobium buryatense TaxID=95641 RepID=A0A4P9UL92_METBY|nr:class I SAM-dependent methyltransferase [Methylotuvimicrobium buryatense]QCW81994.1 hypothetical protein EQU24_06810 [Methylotuvimicrobium buryatense]